MIYLSLKTGCPRAWYGWYGESNSTSLRILPLVCEPCWEEGRKTERSLDACNRSSFHEFAERRRPLLGQCLVFPSKAKDDRLYILYLQSNLLRLRPTTMIFQPPLNDSRHRTSCRLSLVVRLLVEPLATQVKLLYSFVAFIRRVGVLVEACLEGASFSLTAWFVRGHSQSRK